VGAQWAGSKTHQQKIDFFSFKRAMWLEFGSISSLETDGHWKWGGTDDFDVG
jgi:hypothetical protein